MFLSFFGVWSNFNKLKVPGQYVWGRCGVSCTATARCSVHLAFYLVTQLFSPNNLVVRTYFFPSDIFVHYYTYYIKIIRNYYAQHQT